MMHRAVAWASGAVVMGMIGAATAAPPESISSPSASRASALPGGLAASGGEVTSTSARQPTTQELLEQIRQLQAKVHQLEARQNQNQNQTNDHTERAVPPPGSSPTTANGAADAWAGSDAAQQVLRDAQRRSVWLQTLPFSSNWQAGKFELRSDDGNFLLHPWIQFQVRGVVNYRNDPAGAGGSDTESGFEIRRMKLGFDGNAFSPGITYLFNWATNRNTGNLQLEEAWVRGKITDEWSVRGGQIKDPFAHESIMSAKKSMAVDRAVLTNLFTGGDNFVQGVAAAYSRDAFQAEVALHDGQNDPNTDFEDFPTGKWDFGVAGRVQYKLFGDWSAYEQFTSLNDKQDLLVVGGGADLSQAGNTSQLLHTVDVQYNQTTGLGLYGAYFGRYTQNAPAGVGVPPAVENDTYDWGVVAQGSYLFPKSKWEIFGLYNFIRFDSASVPAGATQNVNVIGVGGNYYVHDHDAKFTLDLLYLPDGIPVSETGGDVLSSNDDELVLRGQFQLLL